MLMLSSKPQLKLSSMLLLLMLWLMLFFDGVVVGLVFEKIWGRGANLGSYGFRLFYLTSSALDHLATALC